MTNELIKKQIDQLVYKLYGLTPEEIATANHRLIKLYEQKISDVLSEI